MNLLTWLSIPFTAYASLNPVPVTLSKTLLLGEESAYVVDYPVDHQNALTSFVEPHSTSTDEVMTLLQQYFPQNWQKMHEIAKAESSLDPKAYNPESHETCHGSYGLLQIGCGNYKGNPTDLFDPETNIRIAKEVYDKQGYEAWGVCTRHMVECE